MKTVGPRKRKGFGTKSRKSDMNTSGRIGRKKGSIIIGAKGSKTRMLLTTSNECTGCEASHKLARGSRVARESPGSRRVRGTYAIITAAINVAIVRVEDATLSSNGVMSMPPAANSMPAGASVTDKI